jgi:hypothetical protein
MTTNQLTTAIEAMLIKRIDTAKRFRDQANAQKNEVLASRWEERAGAFRDALNSIREIAGEEAA